MALSERSLILYGLEVTESNRSIDFKNASGGPEINATLRLGFYSLSGLLIEFARAMFAADPDNIYTATADRTTLGGLQNRVEIATSGTFLSLLFATGSRLATSAGPLLGFPVTDQTGSTVYQGTTSCGTVLIPDFRGYNYLGPEFHRKVFGNVNISASGIKEAVIYQVQKFIQVEYKYETKTKAINEWLPFLEWIIRQRSFDFTPEISFPNTFYDVTMDKTSADGKALEFTLTEMLPSFPDHYQTGLFVMRVNPT